MRYKRKLIDKVMEIYKRNILYLNNLYPRNKFNVNIVVYKLKILILFEIQKEKKIIQY